MDGWMDAMVAACGLMRDLMFSIWVSQKMKDSKFMVLWEAFGQNNKITDLHMAYYLYPAVSILFTSIYSWGEQVGCTSSGVEKHS